MIKIFDHGLEVLAYSLEQQILRAVEEKVAPRKQAHATGGRCLLAPGNNLFIAHVSVFNSSTGRDGTIQRWFRHIPVGFAKREVAAYDWQKGLHEVLIGSDICGDVCILTDFL